MKSKANSEFPRPLTPREREVTRWMILHGAPSEGDRHEYLRQLDRATVVRGCDCGCASVDFAIEGRLTEKGDMDLLGDFVTRGDQHGIFVFAVNGVLAGVEVFEMAADCPCAELPSPSGLSPVIWTDKGLIRGHRNA